jgi:hypothetical protein
VIAASAVYAGNLRDAIRALKNIQRLTRGGSWITLAAYEDENDIEGLMLLRYWFITGTLILTKAEWRIVMEHAGYTGDYRFDTAKSLNLVRWLMRPLASGGAAEASFRLMDFTTNALPARPAFEDHAPRGGGFSSRRSANRSLPRTAEATDRWALRDSSGSIPTLGRHTYVGEFSHVAQHTIIGSFCSIGNLCTIGAQRHRLDCLTSFPFEEIRTSVPPAIPPLEAMSGWAVTPWCSGA